MTEIQSRDGKSVDEYIHGYFESVSNAARVYPATFMLRVEKKPLMNRQHACCQTCTIEGQGLDELAVGGKGHIKPC